MNNWRPGPGMRGNDDRNDDKPPYSKIFIVCHKQIRIESLRSTFETFGHIEDLRLPVDRNTGESKGIAYVKYSKTSSAAAAIKEMHMKTINDCPKPIRVMIATSKHDNPNTNDDKYRRLFIKVGKEQTVNEIKEHFSKFGQVESVYVQRDKATDESRGFAYVYFKTFSDAAVALEECDNKYKPVFATPKDELKRGRNSVANVTDSHHSSSSSMTKDNYDYYSHSKEDIHRDGLTSLIKTRPQDYDSVCATCSPQVPQKYIEKLFNIIPGMNHFKFISDSFNGFCKASITYETQKAAACAVEKLNNFEFPSGEIISVKPDNNPLSKAANDLSSIVNSFKNAIDNTNPDLMQLADAIAQASTLIKAATSSRDVKPEPQEDFCSVSLPPPQPLATTSKVAQRCFLVFKPHPLPVSVLKDVFCRFGDLIDVSTFPNKTFGFAKYASAAAAQDAIKTVHGAIVCGVRLKVLEADEKPTKDDNKMTTDEESSVDHDTGRKRMKFQDGDSNMSG